MVDLYHVLVRTGCGCNHTAGASPQRGFFFFHEIPLVFDLGPYVSAVPGTQNLPASVLLSTLSSSSTPEFSASFSHTENFLGSAQCPVTLIALLEPGQVSLHLLIMSHSAKAFARVQATCGLMTAPSALNPTCAPSHVVCYFQSLHICRVL